MLQEIWLGKVRSQKLHAFPSKLPDDSWILKLGEYLVVNQILKEKTTLNLMFLLLCQGENGITDLKANVLRSIPKVESLILERNAIRSIHHQTFSGAKQLMLLKLYGKCIRNIPPRIFQVKSLDEKNNM